MLIQQKFGWPNNVFRLNMGQWKFLLIEQNIFLGVRSYFILRLPKSVSQLEFFKWRLIKYSGTQKRKEVNKKLLNPVKF